MNILMILGEETSQHDLAMGFIRESYNFLIGLETQLAKKYLKYSVNNLLQDICQIRLQKQ